MNTRPLYPDNLINDVDALVWNVLPNLGLFPFWDLFDSASYCMPTMVASINESRPVLEVFPNPSNGNMTVRYNGKLSAKRNLQIYNAIGELVYSDKFIAGQSELKIEQLNFQSGYYMLKVQDDSNLIVQKIIIQ